MKIIWVILCFNSHNVYKFTIHNLTFLLICCIIFFVIGGCTMINKINKIIDKTSDKIMLKTLKLEITAENADVDSIIDRYVDEFEHKDFETVNYNINLGYNKTLKSCKRFYNRLKPCGEIANYCESNVKARGEQKVMYEIAFGTPNITITTKKLIDEKTKQKKFKEAI